MITQLTVSHRTCDKALLVS